MTRRNREKTASTSTTRRRVMQAIGAGTALGACGLAFTPCAAKETPAARPPGKLKAFALTDVRLAAGPFLDAQKRDEKYLLLLEPDRLLHNFRVNAGLSPKAAVYGGWESVEPWVEIRCHGHTLGHYLTACALMFEATGDQAFKQRVDTIVTELDECQSASRSGLVCAFPDGARQLQNSASGREFFGVPWYTMHKIFAGLRDAHIHAGNAQALTVLRRLADWTEQLTAPMSDAQMQKMLDREHGGMNEVLADLFALTNDEKYLRLAQRFSHRALLQPLSEGRDTLDGLHSNTQIPKVIGFQRLFELTGRDEYRTAAEFFWRTIVENRSYATGGNGDIEHFFPPREFAQRLQSAKTMETCCMHNMLRLTRTLFSQAPSAHYADYYERTLYNGILASQDPESGMFTYFQATRPGYVKLYCTPLDSFWCCTGSGMENHAKYGDSIYFHDDDSLHVNLFIASTLQWRAKGVVIEQVTQFPQQPTTRLRINVSQPTRFALKVRHPQWCDAVTTTVNDRDRTVHRTRSSYFALDRLWRDGDEVDVRLPMRLHVAALPHAPDIVAIMYGPLVLAGRLGKEGVTPGADLIVNERQSGEMLHSARDVPRWKLNRNALNRQLSSSPDKALVFIAEGIDALPGLELIPYYAIAHERYNLYWNVG